MADTVGAPATTPPAARAPRRPFWIGMLVGALVMAAVLTAVQYVGKSSFGTDAFLLKNRYASGVVQTPSGLQYKVLKPGKGAKPTDADIALITYKGTLLNGTEFDKSEQPVPMPVAGVVPGFSEALKLMPKDAEYRIWIKPSLGYGDKAAGPIPANSVLVFDVKLLDFLPEAVVRQMQAAQMGGGAPAPAPAPAEQPKR